MKNILRIAAGVFIIIFLLCIESSAADRAATLSSQPRLTRSIKLMPGVTMTPAQYQQYRKQLDRTKSMKSRVTASTASAGSTPQTAPLLPPRQIDSSATGMAAFAVGDVTGDSRADIVAFGLRPFPNNSQKQITVYPQGLGGIFSKPIRSDVNSQIVSGPGPSGGMVIKPVLGARPDIVIWNMYWIEIYSVSPNGSVAATPLTITPGLAVQQVIITDLNADGLPDLIVLGNDVNDVNFRNVIRHYVQNTGGGFSATGLDSVFPERSGVLADINGDGNLDLLEGIGGNTNFGFTYRFGFADGTFGPQISVMENTQTFVNVGRLFVRDVDGNGLPDVILTTGDGSRIRFQTSPGNFSTVIVPNSGSSGNITQVSFGDLDGNGLTDIIMWTDGYNVMQVAMQTSARVFTAAGLYDVPADGYPSFYETNTAIVDVNGDGKSDVLTLLTGPFVYYNSTGSYPVLDVSITSTVQVEDSGSVAQVEWQHNITNAGPATLINGFVLQDLPLEYEFTSADVPCTFFVTLVACPISNLSAGASTTITVRANSVLARRTDTGIPSLVTILNDGPEIDPNSGNDSVVVNAIVRSHPEELQAAGNEVFVYENAGEAIIPIINSPGTSSLARCAGWYLNGPNPADGGIVGATNGTVCTAPAQGGFTRGSFSLRDGSTTNGSLHYNLAMSTGAVTLPGPNTLTIVDDDGGDPRLTSSGTQPFEAWPALFSSAQTLYSPVGLELPITAAVGDLNGDGRNDLAVSFGSSSGNWISVWLQQPNGTLSTVPLRWNGFGASLAIADVTGDSAAELIVSQFNELDIVRIVNGQLQTVNAVSMDSRHVAVADLDLDGFNDIVVTSNIEQSVGGPQYWVPNVTVFHGNAQRTLDSTPYRFAVPYNGLHSQLVVGRFDDDSLPDIAITSSGNPLFPSASIAYQKQDHTFATPVAVWVAGPGSVDGLAFGDSVTTGDFNGDGRTDLAISSYLDEHKPSVWIFTDLRHDDFSRPSQRLYAGMPSSLASIDIDHDGRDDLLVDYSLPPMGPRTPIQVYIQDGTGKLKDAGKLPKFGSGLTDPWVQKIAVGDLDGDGEKDAVILDSMDGYVHVMHSSAVHQTVQITTLESADSPAASSNTRYRLRISNSGSRRSLEIPISWTLPPQFSALQIVGSKGACYIDSSIAKCLLPQLDPDGYVDVMLTGAFTAAGNYSMPISAGPSGAYGNKSISVTVANASSGNGGGMYGGASSGGSSGGGGSLEWLSLFWMIAFILMRMTEYNLLRFAPKQNERRA